jgi:hypothetical protein
MARNNEKSWDALRLLSKEEIIDFMKREYVLCEFTYAQVHGYIWQKKKEQNQKKFDDYFNKKEDGIGQKMDELAKQANATEDIALKSSLLEKRHALFTQFMANQEVYKKLSKERDQIEAYYDKHLG